VYDVTVSAAQSSTLVQGSANATFTLYGFGGTIASSSGGSPIGGITVYFREGSGNTTGEVVATVVTNTNGTYSVNLGTGTFTGEIIGNSGNGYLTSTFTAISSSTTYNSSENGVTSPIPTINEIRIVLTWGAQPSDLDSHLLGTLSGGGNLHVYYGSKQYYKNSQLVAQLDIDDTSSYGPETTTIMSLTNNTNSYGTYKYYVHNYSGNFNATLRNSGATVSIYYGGSTSPDVVYQIQSGSGSELYWDVFTLLINETGVHLTGTNVVSSTTPVIPS
jgi:hypothetical protein